MYSMKTISRLLTAGVIGLTGVLAGCGGGGAGSTPSYSISVRSVEASLPLNVSGVGPSIGGPYTTTLYVEVKDADGKPVTVAEDGVGCSYVSGLDSGPLYYLDGDSAHEKTETINDVEVTIPTAYRAITLSTNAGLATFHFHASNVVGPATVRCSVTDPGDVVRSAEVTIQVGSTTSSGKVSQVVFAASGANYLYVQGFNGPTQIQLQADVVDEAGQPVEPAAGVNNLQLRIVPDTSTLAEDSATLRGVNANNQAVAGSSILVESINGEAEFTLVSGTTAGTILIEAISDRFDNNVDNGITEAIYNYVAISSVTSAPTQTPTTEPLSISTSSPPAAQGGVPYGALLEAEGGAAPYTWTMLTSGTLPTGLSLSSSGIISGTPFGGVAGQTYTYPFVVQVRDAQGTVVQKGMSMSYTAPDALDTTPSVSVAALTSGTVGQTYNTLLTATGGNPPYTWTAVTGTLPAGLSLSASGVVSGIPSAAGNYTFVLTVSDGSKLSSRTVTMTVNSAPTDEPIIQTVSLPSAKVGTPFAAQFSAVGGSAPYAWTANQFPAGLSFPIPANGVLSGTPLGAGTFTFTVKVTDSLGVWATKDFTLTIAP